MTIQLSASELIFFAEALQGYEPGEAVIALLNQHEGDLESSLSDLVQAEAGTETFGVDKVKLRDAFLKNLRREICGDESFKAKVEEYNKQPGKAALLTGLIVYVLDLVTLPINPAIATIAVLWVLKLGIRTFCDYTDPSEQEPRSQKIL